VLLVLREDVLPMVLSAVLLLLFLLLHFFSMILDLSISSFVCLYSNGAAPFFFRVVFLDIHVRRHERTLVFRLSNALWNTPLDVYFWFVLLHVIFLQNVPSESREDSSLLLGLRINVLVRSSVARQVC